MEIEETPLMETMLVLDSVAQDTLRSVHEAARNARTSYDAAYVTYSAAGGERAAAPVRHHLRTAERAWQAAEAAIYAAINAAIAAGHGHMESAR